MKALNVFALAVIVYLITGCGGGGTGGGVTPPPVELPNKPYGLCFGPFVDGSNPDHGAVPTVATVNRLYNTIRPFTSAVRIYTCAPLKDSTESMASLAKAKGFTVAAGCWLSRDGAANIREINYLIAEMRRGNVDLAIVGSEVLLRNDLTPEQLIALIEQVKIAVPGIPVTTDDTYHEILANPTVVEKIDKIMVNIYPFWEGKTIAEAFDHFKDCYDQVKNKYPGKEVIIGETGWPSDGNIIGNAVPNLINFQNYLEKVLMWSNYYRVKGYYFEAFDEPWKETNEGPLGAHWGLWTKDALLKPGVLEIFSKTPVVEEPILPQITIDDVTVPEGDTLHSVNVPVRLSEPSTQTVTVNWATQEVTATAGLDYTAASGTATFNPGTVTANISIAIKGDTIVEANESFKINLTNPVKATLGDTSATVTLTNDDTDEIALVIDSCPAIGSFANVYGHCTGVNPLNYRIVVYIKVAGTWWIKPYFDSPLTPIGTDGKWSCDVTTGGVDSTASHIAIYQVVAGYTPPTNPASLDQTKIFLQTTIDRNNMPVFPLKITP